MANRSITNGVAVIGCLVIGVTAAAVFSAGYGDTRRAVVLGVVMTALIAFFGFLWLGIQQQSTKTLTDRSMRTALAAATVLSYLVLVGMGVWFPKTANETSTTGDALLTNFTTIVGVIVAFYFGSSAYIEGKQRQRSGGESEPR